MDQINQQLKKMEEHKELFLTAGIITILVLILLGMFLFMSNRSAVDAAQEGDAAALATTTEPVYNPFDDVRIAAQAAIVKDLRSGKVLYEKNAYAPLPLASITKVVTALTAADIFKAEGKTAVQITAAHLAPEGDDSLIPGEHFTVPDLLNYTLVASSNDGARALAQSAGSLIATPPQTGLEAFIARMNTVAATAGMEKATFYNESGLDEDEAAREAGAFASARDVAELFAYTLNNAPQLLEATRADNLTVESKEGYAHKTANTNKVVGDLPNIIGSKTGYTYTAGGNLAVVIDPSLGQPIVIVVLGSSKEGRFADVERLAAATLEQLSLSE
jgi:D-alanyl-D-alanine carboxypeptidase